MTLQNLTNVVLSTVYQRVRSLFPHCICAACLYQELEQSQEQRIRYQSEFGGNLVTVKGGKSMWPIFLRASFL